MSEMSSSHSPSSIHARSVTLEQLRRPVCSLVKLEQPLARNMTFTSSEDVIPALASVDPLDLSFVAQIDRGSTPRYI